MQKTPSLYSETAFQYYNQGIQTGIKPIMNFILGGNMDFFNTVDPVDDILIVPDSDEPRGAGIDYENPNEVAELTAWHLAKIFRATFKKKLDREVEKLKI